MSESVCGLFNSRVSVSYNLLGLLDTSHVWFSKSDILGVCLSSANPEVLCACCRALNPSLLREKLHICEIPSTCGSLCWGWGFWWDYVSACPIPFDVPFFSFVVQSCSASFRVFFRETCSMCNCRFDVSLGVGEFKVFLSSSWILKILILWHLTKLVQTYIGQPVIHRQWFRILNTLGAQKRQLDLIISDLILKIHFPLSDVLNSIFNFLNH